MNQLVFDRRFFHRRKQLRIVNAGILSGKLAEIVTAYADHHRQRPPVSLRAIEQEKRRTNRIGPVHETLF